MKTETSTGSLRTPRATLGTQLRRLALCLAVLAVASTVIAASWHRHPAGAEDELRCTLCTIAHQAALAPETAALDITSPALAARLSVEPREEFAGRDDSDRHAPRAPPSASFF